MLADISAIGVRVTLLSLLVYIPLQMLFIPLAIVGFVLVAWRQIGVSKKLGVSQTAVEILNGRWTMHVFGLREDEACAGLAAALPNTSVAGLWLALFPLWLKYRISGKPFLYPRIPEPGAESIADMVVTRTLYFDRVIDRVIDEVEQFVVMGAGYDTRAYGDFGKEGVKLFELDQANVQQNKRQALADAGVSSERVHFVTVDFGSEDLFEALTGAGYEPNRRSLFLWEGVSLYLPEADVRRTMHRLGESAPAGSVLLADFYAERFLAIVKKSVTGKVLEYTDEGLGFGLPFASDHEQVLTEFIESESMTVGETFFLGHAGDKGPYMVVAEVIL
jgi:methyltransferase (TIGR00027 family)